MTRTATHIARSRRHAALLSGCALALVLVATPQTAAAQDANKGFQGNPTVNDGSATFATPAGSKLTGINVTTPQAVITWTPDDTATSGTIDFLPSGHTASFTSALADYTVLNRILPGGTATIGINGTVTSTTNSGRTPGGNVWFYTPNGFVVGPSAVIQVGGLVMTTNDIVYGAANTGGDMLTDANGYVMFRGPADSKSSISIAQSPPSCTGESRAQNAGSPSNAGTQPQTMRPRSSTSAPKLPLPMSPRSRLARRGTLAGATLMRRSPSRPRRAGRPDRAGRSARCCPCGRRPAR